MYSEIPSGGILDNTQCNNQSCGIDTVHNATIKKSWQHVEADDRID